MPTYKTPGVYVEEIVTLPPSVAAVATAIPAFLGYTESGPIKQPVRLTSMVDFAQSFGGPKSTAFTVNQTLSGDLQVTKTLTDGKTPPDYLMYYSLKMYFDNGGGPCYVVSVGNYGPNRQHSDFTDGLNALAKEDEPTLILLTDAVNLADPNDYYGLCGEALAQCEKLGNRFAILDVLDGDNGGQAFRNAPGIGVNHLKYGAAYYPYLKTTLPYDYHDKSQVTVILASTYQPAAGGIRVISTYPSPNLDIQPATTAGAPLDFAVTDASSTLTIKNVPAAGIDAQALVDAWKAWKAKNTPLNIDVTQVGDASIKVQPTSGPIPMPPLSASTSTLDTLVNSQTQVYNQVVAALAAAEDRHAAEPGDRQASTRPSTVIAGSGRHRPMSASLRSSVRRSRSPTTTRTTSTSTRPPASRSTPSAASPARGRWSGAHAPWPATTTSGGTSTSAGSST